MTGSRTVTNRATLPSLGLKVALSLLLSSSLSSVCGLDFCPCNIFVFLFAFQGVNIGGAGSYVYDDPVNEAPAAVSMETNRNPEEEKRAPARGPVKGEKRTDKK